MKKSRFSDSQIMDALKRVEAGLSVPDVCRELGISSATFYKWRAKFGGMDASCRSRATKCGPWTSCTTSWKTDAAFAYSM